MCNTRLQRGFSGLQLTQKCLKLVLCVILCTSEKITTTKKWLSSSWADSKTILGFWICFKIDQDIQDQWHHISSFWTAKRRQKSLFDPQNYIKYTIQTAIVIRRRKCCIRKILIKWDDTLYNSLGIYACPKNILKKQKKIIFLCSLSNF